MEHRPSLQLRDGPGKPSRAGLSCLLALREQPETHQHSRAAYKARDRKMVSGMQVSDGQPNFFLMKTPFQGQDITAEETPLPRKA